MRAALLLAPLLLLAACGKRERPPSAIQREAAEAESQTFSTKLYETLRGAHASGPCASIVPGEWPEGFPVPAEASRGRKFKIFFYPMSSEPGTPTFGAPAAEALLDLDAGKAVSCERLPGTPKELPGPRWPAAIAGIGAFPAHALSKKLYDRTEAVAAVYGGEGIASAADIAAAKEFIRLFKLNAEPSLLPYYYRLNPAFWEWLRATAGDSIPAA